MLTVIIRSSGPGFFKAQGMIICLIKEFLSFLLLPFHGAYVKSMKIKEVHVTVEEPPSVFIKKVVPYAVLLVFNYRIQLDILNAPENVCLNKRVCLFQFCDQFLCFKPFA